MSEQTGLLIEEAIDRYKEKYAKKYGPVKEFEIAEYVFREQTPLRAKQLFSLWKNGSTSQAKVISPTHIIRLCRKLKTTPNQLYGYPPKRENGR